MGFFHTLFLIVGSIIGSMAWLIYSPMIARSSVIDCIVSFPLAALILLPLIFCIAELSSMFPKSGGPYIYLKETYDLLPGISGKVLGFLAGWTYWMTFVVGTALMLNGLCDLVTRNHSWSEVVFQNWFSPVLIGAILVVTSAVNYFPIKNLALLNAVLTLIKLGILAAFWALGVSKFQFDSEAFAGGSGAVVSGNLFSVLVFSLGCFAGVEGTGCIASEAKNPQENIPRVIILVVLILVCIYTTTAFVVGFSSDFLASEGRTRAVIPATLLEATVPGVARFLAGQAAGDFFNGAVIFSICACALPTVLYGARVLHSVSSQTLGSEVWLSQLHKPYLVPLNAVNFQFIAMAVVAIALCNSQQLRIIPNAFSFLGESFGFIYSVLGVQYALALTIMRIKRPYLSRPFRIWGRSNLLAFIVAAFVLATFSYIAVFTIGTAEQLVGLCLILLGIPVYFLCYFFAKFLRKS